MVVANYFLGNIIKKIKVYTNSLWFYWYVALVEVNYQGSIRQAVKSFVYIHFNKWEVCYVYSILETHRGGPGSWICYLLPQELDNSLLLTCPVNITFLGQIPDLKLLSRCNIPFSKSDQLLQWKVFIDIAAYLPA